MSDRTCTVPECNRPTKARGLCPRHYGRWQSHGHTETTRTPGLFDEHYTPGQPGECWPWRGSYNGYGYGRFGRRMAHRMVYERLVGPIPSDLFLDHLCRNRGCVNPAHLQPVTNATNIERGLSSYQLRYLCKNGLHNISEPTSWYVNGAGVKTCLECKRENDRRAEAKRPPRRRR